MEKVDPFFSSTLRHFSNLLARYGGPVVLLNLVRVENCLALNVWSSSVGERKEAARDSPQEYVGWGHEVYSYAFASNWVWTPIGWCFLVHSSTEKVNRPINTVVFSFVSQENEEATIRCIRRKCGNWSLSFISNHLCSLGFQESRKVRPLHSLYFFQLKFRDKALLLKDMDRIAQNLICTSPYPLASLKLKLASVFSTLERWQQPPLIQRACTTHGFASVI